MLLLFIKNVWSTLNGLKTFKFLKTISELCVKTFSTLPRRDNFLKAHSKVWDNFWHLKAL